MRRISTFLMLSVILISSASALEFSFANDGGSWGFIPEWDDYETYAFSLEQSWGDFTADIDYDCYTYRAGSVEDAARIDSVQLSSLWSWNATPFDSVNIKLTGGGSVRFFGDWYGLEIQTGWHHNIAVQREVPLNYELPFFQFSVPAGLVVSHEGINGLELSLSGSAGYPLEISGKVEAAYAFGEPFFPFRPALGYRIGLYPGNSAAYRISMEKQSGPYIADSISIWPVVASRVYFIQQQWGTGVFGFTTDNPSDDSDSSICLQLMLSGITTQSYGIKAAKRIMEDLLLENLNLWITFTSLTGWSPEEFIAPEDGRFSIAVIGAEPTWSVSAGPVRLELAGFLNGGIRQNNYYDIDRFVQTPKQTEYLLMLETGAGAKLLLPFLNDRMLGPAFEIARQWRFASFPQAAAGLSAPEVPFRINLSLAVTGK